MSRIAIQGVEASFHDIASKQFFGDTLFSTVYCDTFKEVFTMLDEGTADYAVVAVENSLHGPVNQVYDLLLDSHFWIVGEVLLRIEHCLIGLPGAQLSGITEVHSHEVAIPQCEDFLDSKLPNARRIVEHDTAGSVVKIKEAGDKHLAAIASTQAANLHSMQVIASNIETNQENFTRFIILTKQHTRVDGANKTSLILQTKDDTHAGILYHALKAFADRQLNLTLLHSRPIIGKAWHYMFYIDVEAGIADQNLKQALLNLEEQHFNVKVLGSYEKAVYQQV